MDTYTSNGYYKHYNKNKQVLSVIYSNKTKIIGRSNVATIIT